MDRYNINYTDQIVIVYQITNKYESLIYSTLNHEF